MLWLTDLSSLALLFNSGMAADTTNVEFILLPAEQAKLLILREQSYSIIGVSISSNTEIEKLCDVNINPQYDIDDESSLSAIAYVFYNSFIIRNLKQQQKVVFTTTHPHLDSFGAISLLWRRLESHYEIPYISMEMTNRIEEINTISNIFSHGYWRRRNPELDPTNHPLLRGIARYISNSELSMRDRVESVKNWLETGKEPSNLNNPN